MACVYLLGGCFIQSKQLSPRKLQIGSSIIFLSHMLTQTVELESQKPRLYTQAYIPLMKWQRQWQ